MAARLSAQVDIQTRNAERNLNRLQSEIQQTRESVNRFQGALASLGVGALIRSSLQAAASINDLSRSTGIAIERVRGLSEAFTANGGTADRALDAINDLTKNIGEAAAGSAELQRAFGLVGIGLDELRSLSEEDILRTTIQGLSEMEDAAQRTSVAQRIFGESVRAVDFTGVNAQFDQFSRTAVSSVSAIERAAEANAKLALAAQNLNIAIANSISPIIDFTGAADSSVNTLQRVTDTIRNIIGVFGALALIVLPIGRLFKGASTAVNFLRENLWATSGIIGGLITLLDELTGGLFDLSDAVDSAGDSLNKNTQNSEDNAKSTRQVTEANKQAIQAIRDSRAAFEETYTQQLRNLQIERDLIGATDQRRLTVQATREAVDAYNDRITDLNNQLNALTVTEADFAQRQIEIANAILDADDAIRAQVESIPKLTEQIVLANRAQRLQEFATSENLKAQQKMATVVNQIARGPLSELESKYYDIVDAANESAQAAILAEQARRGEPLNIEEIRQYYAAAAEGAQKLIILTQRLNDQQRSFEYGWRTAFKNFRDDARNYARQAEQIFSTFTRGIEDAFVKFAQTGKLSFRDLLTDLSEQILRSQIQQTLASVLSLKNPFGSGTVSDMFGGIFGSLLGGTIQPGSSPSRPLFVVDVNGMRGGGTAGIDLKQLLPQVPGISPGQQNQQSGGILDSIGKIFSGQNSTIGSISQGTGIVGGISNAIKGILGGSSAPSSAPSRTPSFNPFAKDNVFTSAASSIGGGIVDTVSSIGKFFGGFFANGGMIPAGKFGIVGERGPELALGPTAISPMGGGGSVTYNINAVDAQSFKELVARDPQFLFAVTEQGRKSLPGTRR